jgi:hypothetical protein
VECIEAVLVAQACRFALDLTPAQQRALGSDCGASRFAYNWGLGLVKDRLEERERVREAGYREQLSDVEVEALARTRFMTGALGGSGRTRVRLARIGQVCTHEPAVQLLSGLRNAKRAGAVSHRFLPSGPVIVLVDPCRSRARTRGGLTRSLVSRLACAIWRCSAPALMMASRAHARWGARSSGCVAMSGALIVSVARAIPAATGRMGPRSKAAGAHDALAVSARPRKD